MLNILYINAYSISTWIIPEMLYFFLVVRNDGIKEYGKTKSNGGFPISMESYLSVSRTSSLACVHCSYFKKSFTYENAVNVI